MGEVSFVKPGAVSAAPEVAVESTTQVAGEAPVTRVDNVENIPTASAMVPVASPVGVPAVVRDEPAPFYDDENIGFNDIKLPRINIVQKVGELSNTFAGGEIVLNQGLPIYTPPTIKDGVIIKPGTKPLNIVVIGFRPKQFVEKVNGNVMGALCNSEEEVGRLGGTLNYKEHETKVANKIPSKLFQEMATALLLIEKPEQLADTDHLCFPQEHEGKFYALALWSMKGGSYTNGAKTFYTARKMGHLRVGGYHSYSWSLGTKLEAYKTGNFAYIPVLTNGTKSSESFLAFVKGLVGAGR